MADTIRDEAALQALFADNTTRSISPQKIRDFLVSVPSLASTANLALAGGTMTGDVLFSTNNARDVGSSAARARMLYTVGTTTDFIYGGSSPFNWIGYGNATDCTVMVGGSGPFGVKTRSGGMYGWVASGALVAGAAIDTALARNAAGVVEVNNGTAGTYRDLIARHVIINGPDAFTLGGGSAVARVTYLASGSIYRFYTAVDSLASVEVGAVKLPAGRLRARTTTATTPTTAEFGTDMDFGIHRDSATGNVWLAYNDGGTIKKVQLT